MSASDYTFLVKGAERAGLSFEDYVNDILWKSLPTLEEMVESDENDTGNIDD